MNEDPIELVIHTLKLINDVTKDFVNIVRKGKDDEDSFAIQISPNYVLDKDGLETYEPMPSERSEQFIKDTRFTQQEAVERGVAYLRRNGLV